jgi:hypothetical protein
MVRLYRGNGGATTKFSYSVTFQSAKQAERQFFYAYGAPDVKHIVCNGEDVVLISSNGSSRTISTSQITGELLKQPIGYYDGELRGQPSLIPVWAWPAGLAVLMFAVSLFSLLRDRIA